MNKQKTKKCSFCLETKTLRNFYKHTQTKDGYRFYCKKCTNLQGKNWRLNNLEACRARSRIHNTSLNHKYRNYQWNAKRRKIEFGLSKEQVKQIVSHNCFYCGGNEHIGIDRVNNFLGYFLDNCVPCCMRCNRMKSNLDFNDFILHIGRIYKTRC